MANEASLETKSAVALPSEFNEEIYGAELTEEDKDKIQEIVKHVNFNDSQAMVQYGFSAQNEISNFTDRILEQVRVKDSGVGGEILTDLMFKVKELDVNSFAHEADSFFSKIPLVGSVVNSTRRFINRYQKLSVEIEEIVEQLEKNMMQLLKDISIFDALHHKNKDHIKNLSIYILAGKLILKELREKAIPAAQEKAKNSSDPSCAQDVNDLIQLTDRFDKKINDLLLTRMVAIQMGPQIRLVQNNDQVLVEKIQSSILNTIPLWKGQITISIGLHRQKAALETQKEITDTTNELLLKNSELIKDNSIEITRESEKSIVDFETLKKVNANLISTLEETVKIQEEGRAKRQAAEAEILNMEKEVRNKIASLATR